MDKQQNLKATKALIDFGLSEKETKVYLALIELGTAGVGDISKRASINRSSTYVVMESLMKKRLASLTASQTSQEYIATTPETLLEYADDKAKKQKELRDKIEEIVPELRANHKNTKHRPKVYIYTGQEAVKQAFYAGFYPEQISRGMKKYRVYEDLTDIKKFLPPDFIKNDAMFIKSTGVNMHIISPDNEGSRSVINEYGKHGSNNNFLVIPEKKFNSGRNIFSSFSIYEDKIEFFTSKDLFFLVTIESKEIADTLKSVYDLAWEASKKLNRHRKK